MREKRSVEDREGESESRAGRISFCPSTHQGSASKTVSKHWDMPAIHFIHFVWGHRDRYCCVPWVCLRLCTKTVFGDVFLVLMHWRKCVQYTFFHPIRRKHDFELSWHLRTILYSHFSCFPTLLSNHSGSNLKKPTPSEHELPINMKQFSTSLFSYLPYIEPPSSVFIHPYPLLYCQFCYLFCILPLSNHTSFVYNETVTVAFHLETLHLNNICVC